MQPGPTVESLTQRREMFQLMQGSHLRWMDETDDPNVKELHRSLADQLQALAEQYRALLNIL